MSWQRITVLNNTLLERQLSIHKTFISIAEIFVFQECQNSRSDMRKKECDAETQLTISVYKQQLYYFCLTAGFLKNVVVHLVIFKYTINNIHML